MMKEMVSLALLASLVSMATAYGTGPPVEDHPEICYSMFPTGHNSDPSGMASPFVIVPSSVCFKPGMDIEVEVRVNDGNDGYYFEGMFVQARSYPFLNVSHGVFSTTDGDLKSYGCWGETSNAVGHQRKAHYTNKKFTWTPPTGHTTNIHFLATVVHETTEFWVGLRSIDLVYTNTCGSSASGKTNKAMLELLASAISCSLLLLLW